MPMHNGRNRIADRQRKTSRKRTNQHHGPAKRKATTPPSFPNDVRVPTGSGNRFLAVAAPLATPHAILLPVEIKPASPGKSATATNSHTRNAGGTRAAPAKRPPATIAAPGQTALPAASLPTAALPAVSLPAVSPPDPVTPRAIPLPNLPEPQALPHPPIAHRGHMSDDSPARPQVQSNPDLPRNRTLAKPDQGLIAAISNWLRSAKGLIAANFLVTKRRAPKGAAHRPPHYSQKRMAQKRMSPKLMPAPGLREQAELTQLRAENRRLRSELEALLVLQQSSAQKPASPVPASTV